jgi:hypothetical protein
MNLNMTNKLPLTFHWLCGWRLMNRQGDVVCVPPASCPLYLSFLFACFAAFASCTNVNKRARDSHNDSNVSYIPMKDIRYQQAVINSGTELEILGNLCGKENNGDTIYYHQFIAIHKATGDTIGILCPQITVTLPGENENKTSTSPLSYDMSKGVTAAFFESIDSSKSLILNAENMDRLVKDSIAINHLLNPKNEISMVVLDNADSRYSIFNYKIAVGKLNFRQVPW